MGIVNVTPDSFHDGGRFADPGRRHCPRAAADRGGRRHPRPRRRVDPPGRGCRAGRAGTGAGAAGARGRARQRRAGVDRHPPAGGDAGRPCRRGGDDQRRQCAASAGRIEAVAETDASVCLMHMQGEPRTMQQAPRYADVVAEVTAFLAARIDACVAGRHRAQPDRRRPGFRLRQALRGQSGAGAGAAGAGDAGAGAGRFSRASR
jgi:dihydropteroate synthase